MDLEHFFRKGQKQQSFRIITGVGPVISCSEYHDNTTNCVPVLATTPVSPGFVTNATLNDPASKVSPDNTASDFYIRGFWSYIDSFHAVDGRRPF